MCIRDRLNDNRTVQGGEVFSYAPSDVVVSWVFERIFEDEAAPQAEESGQPEADGPDEA